jgi:hypothetical protein
MAMKNKLLDMLAPMDRLQAIAERRCNGISTGEAMKLIGQAILEPGKWFEVRDHRDALVPQAKELKFRTIQEIVGRLGLKHFEKRVGGKQIWIRSNHIVPEASDEQKSEQAGPSLIVH